MVASTRKARTRLPSSTAGIADQLIWSLQNFIPLFSVSRFLPDELNNFALVAACLAVLTGGVLQVAGEYLSTWNRALVVAKDPVARAALWRRSMAAGAAGAAIMVAGSIIFSTRGPAGLATALAWGAVVALPLQAYEAERVWLLLTKQTSVALRVDSARLGIHLAVVTALYLAGIDWSMGIVVSAWGLSAFVVTLAATRTRAVEWLRRDIAHLELHWKRQGRYGVDYLLFLGPENLAIFVMGIVGSYSFTGALRLAAAAFTAANAAIVGVRALNTVPLADPSSPAGKKRIVELAAGGAAIMVVTGALAALVPADWVATVIGTSWYEARQALGGITLQRLGATFVVFATLWFRWIVDDYAASLTRRVWAVGVLIGASATGIAASLGVAAWVYGATALFGAIVAIAVASWLRIPPKHSAPAR